MRRIAIYPCFNQQILYALEKMLSNAPANSKLITIVMNEMAIKEGISYDRARDAVEGTWDPRKWKQPVGYFLASGPMGGEEMKNLLLQCIDKLHEIGLTVLVVIGDQGSNNRNMFQTHLHVSKEKPYFLHKSNKVFVMYDTLISSKMSETTSKSQLMAKFA